MNEVRQMTTKEIYDAEMKSINEATHQAKGKELDTKQEINELADDAEKIMDEMEDPKSLDKSMGDEKEPVGPGPFSMPPSNTTTMTQEQFHKMKEARVAQESLQALRQITTSHLSSKDQKALDLILAKVEAGEVSDIVLVELLEEKKSTAVLIVKAMAAISELQKKLLNDVAMASNNLVKARGAMEGLDHMILKRKRKLDIKDMVTKAPENIN